MDSLIAAAARALGTGDAIGALKRVSLREDPPALALRGIAMAQLGDHPRARELLRRAARGFGAHEALLRARCVVAEAEVALAMRDLGGSPRALLNAAAALDERADHANASHARLIAVRRLLLLGRLDEAASSVQRIDLRGLPQSMIAVAEMAAAEVALRTLRTAAAGAALARAQAAAHRSGVAALINEVAEARATLERPAARRFGHDLPLRLDAVEALLRDRHVLVLDALRHGLRAADTWVPLARRPILFTLARTLAEAWPADVNRNLLIERAFRTRRPDETHRARLRVEIGRLRALAKPLARIEATERGFALVPQRERQVAVLMPPIDGDQASLLALLADGAAWSTSALALALDASQRSVQRALVELQAAQRVRSIGRGRSQRWLSAPLSGFTTILLLPAALPLT
ncbi:MAG: helix-turn-helix domain-containing protein [Burkholderiaceae bacterium]|nr:helix-turn-helix domain-containing protein [Burkholderiaceae bacterium]